MDSVFKESTCVHDEKETKQLMTPSVRCGAVRCGHCSVQRPLDIVAWEEADLAVQRTLPPSRVIHSHVRNDVTLFERELASCDIAYKTAAQQWCDVSQIQASFCSLAVIICHCLHFFPYEGRGFYDLSEGHLGAS